MLISSILAELYHEQDLFELLYKIIILFIFLLAFLCLSYQSSHEFEDIERISEDLKLSLRAFLGREHEYSESGSSVVVERAAARSDV